NNQREDGKDFRIISVHIGTHIMCWCKVFLDLMFNMDNWKEFSKKFAEDAILILDSREIIKGRKAIYKYFYQTYGGLGWEQITTSNGILGNKFCPYKYGTVSLLFGSGEEVSKHRYVCVFSRVKKEKYVISMMITNRDYEEEDYDYRK
ncbi:unnamed protein product, partial [Owenia fusiformis]